MVRRQEEEGEGEVEKVLYMTFKSIAKKASGTFIHYTESVRQDDLRGTTMREHTATIYRTWLNATEKYVYKTAESKFAGFKQGGEMQIGKSSQSELFCQRRRNVVRD